MITSLILIITGLLCIYAAITDIRRLEIDNWVSLGVAGLFILYGLLTPVLWVAHIVVMIFVLLLGLVLMRTNIMGGGDVKLITVLSLWAGITHLPLLMISISVAGALVALATIALQKENIIPLKFISKSTGLAWIDQARNGGSTVAYGIAIAIGALIMLTNIGGLL